MALASNSQLGGARIVAVDYTLPEREITNEELDRQHPRWRVAEVALRTGVISRRWCGPGETALDLGERACRQLAARTGLDLARADALLFCTQSPDYLMPPNACLLQHRLSLPPTVAALDFTLACSGYIYGLYLAKSLIESGAATNVLLVSAETYSKRFHPDDRGPATLFGDGGAATWISTGAGIGPCLLGTDGSAAAWFSIPGGGARHPSSAETARPAADESGNVRSSEHIHMNGVAVLEFVKNKIPGLVRALLAREALTWSDIDLVIFHQASEIALKYLQDALNIPAAKVFRNLARVGNTVSASIPIALRDAEIQGLLRPESRILLTGFGVGLSWGGCIVNW